MQLQRDLSVSYERLGDTAIAQEQFDAAKQYFGDALARWEDLLSRMPDDIYVHHARCVGYDRLAQIALASGDLTGARRLWSQATAIARRSVDIDPTNARYQTSLANFRARLAGLDAAETAEPAHAVPQDGEATMSPVEQAPVAEAAPVPRQRHGWLNWIRRR